MTDEKKQKRKRKTIGIVYSTDKFVPNDKPKKTITNSNDNRKDNHNKTI